MRLDHFTHAIEEQHERYALQEEVEAARTRKEAGRERLLEMAGEYDARKQRPLRGFRLWLARLFGLIT